MLTENVCGWCLYGGLCSGTPDLCPVPAGVINSYLMVCMTDLHFLPLLVNMNTYSFFFIAQLSYCLLSLILQMFSFSSLGAVLDMMMCVQL